MKRTLVFFFFAAFLFLTSCDTKDASGTPEYAQLKPGRNPVTFLSEGAKLVGDLYLPTNFDVRKRYAVLLVDGPQSGLKDQVAGVYARKLAEAGYVALAYDHRFYGESEGMPRQRESPQQKVVDNKNAVTFLLSLPFTDPARLGGVGICAGGGIMSATVAQDKRLKTLIGIAAAYNDASQYPTWFGGEDNLRAFINTASASRRKFEQTGEVDYIASVSNDPNVQAAMPILEPTNEPYLYYGTPRGFSPHYVNRMAVMSYEDILQFDVLTLAPTINTPVLIIHGTTDVYTTPQQARTFYANLRGTTDKEYAEITTTNHIDLYDQEVYVDRATSKTVGWLAQRL